MNPRCPCFMTFNSELCCLSQIIPLQPMTMTHSLGFKNEAMVVGNMEDEELGPFQDIFLEEKISTRLSKLIKCKVLKIRRNKTDNSLVHGILCDKKYMIAATFSKSCIREFEGANLHAELEGAYIDVQEYILYPSVETEEEKLEFLLCIEDFNIAKKNTVGEKNDNLLVLSKNEGIKQRLRYLSKLNKFAKSLKYRGSASSAKASSCQNENHPGNQASQELMCSGEELEKDSSLCLKSIASDLDSHKVVPEYLAIAGDSGCNQSIDIFHKPHRTVARRALSGAADDTANRPIQYASEPSSCRGSKSNEVHDSSRGLFNRENKLDDGDGNGNDDDDDDSGKYHEIEASQGFFVSKDAQKELLVAKQICMLEPDSSLLSAEDSAGLNKESGVSQENNLHSLEHDQGEKSLIQERISYDSMSQYMDTDEDQDTPAVSENGKAKALQDITIMSSVQNMTVTSSESAAAKYSPSFRPSNNEQACEKNAEHQVSPLLVKLKENAASLKNIHPHFQVSPTKSHTSKKKGENSPQSSFKEAPFEVVPVVVMEKQENDNCEEAESEQTILTRHRKRKLRRKSKSTFEVHSTAETDDSECKPQSNKETHKQDQNLPANQSTQEKNFTKSQETQSNFKNKWKDEEVWKSILAFWTDKRNHSRRSTVKERLQLLERFHHQNGR